eukprot:TRINITY_DN45247_c0_g1_i1.p1 TRINITY_DN45247_c0_g1~~TRINITY_DN45247_c0_g1_i1.p1  ORF type:complete len:391 (-),score=57.02 TRINITY_DN45247_c0_g1_i1:32-1204(-)
MAAVRLRSLLLETREEFGLSVDALRELVWDVLASLPYELHPSAEAYSRGKLSVKTCSNISNSEGNIEDVDPVVEDVDGDKIEKGDAALHCRAEKGITLVATSDSEERSHVGDGVNQSGGCADVGKAGLAEQAEVERKVNDIPQLEAEEKPNDAEVQEISIEVEEKLSQTLDIYANETPTRQSAAAPQENNETSCAMQVCQSVGEIHAFVETVGDTQEAHGPPIFNETHTSALAPTSTSTDEPPEPQLHGVGGCVTRETGVEQKDSHDMLNTTLLQTGEGLISEADGPGKASRSTASYDNSSTTVLHRAQAFKALMRDDVEELRVVLADVPLLVWSKWVNGAGVGLMKSSIERGAFRSYRLLSELRAGQAVAHSADGDGRSVLSTPKSSRQ